MYENHLKVDCVIVNYEYLAEISKEYGLEMVSITGFGDIYAKTIKEGKNMHLSEIKNPKQLEHHLIPNPYLS